MRHGKKGAWCLCQVALLKDGTAMRVEAVKAPRKAGAKKKRPLQPVGRWQGKPGELQRLLDKVQ